VDRKVAAEVIWDRVMKALGRYHITREALAHDEALSTFHLFPEDDFHHKIRRKCAIFSRG
jgi:hypothetical protein